MNVWLISPAWQRFAVTRTVLTERRWLCDELASRGLTANSVIVADDQNLDIAAEHGFPTVELGNDDLGERFNAGYRYAAEQGADVFVHIGSDNWVHPDAFNVLLTDDIHQDAPIPDLASGAAAVWHPSPRVIAYRRMCLVDIARNAAQRCVVEGGYGCIPWLIPRRALEPESFAPIKTAGLKRGIDGAVRRGLSTRPTWMFQDNPAEWCVDFKTATNITAYTAIAGTLGDGPETDAWSSLEPWYGHALVDLARANMEAV